MAINGNEPALPYRTGREPALGGKRRLALENGRLKGFWGNIPHERFQEIIMDVARRRAEQLIWELGDDLEECGDCARLASEGLRRLSGIDDDHD